MYNKTTTVKKTQYFDVADEIPADTLEQMKIIDKLPFQSSKLYHTTKNVTIKAKTGIIALIVTDSLNTSLEYFVLHGVISLHPNMYFALLKVTDAASYYIDDVGLNSVLYPTTIQLSSINEKLFLPRIYASYHQIKNSPYYFEYETHPYWEVTVVESGTLHTVIDGIEYSLNKNQFMFYGPYQKHNQRVKEGICSYITFIFELYPIQTLLLNQVFTLSQKQIRLVQQLIDFSNNLEKEFYPELYINHMKELILLTLSGHGSSESPQYSMRFNYEDGLMNDILEYIHRNIYKNIKITDICQTLGISRATVQNLFRKHLEQKPKTYINKLKLKESKILITQSKYTLSEIADLLGYATIHYFSRSFKEEYNVTPSDYAKSLIKK